jgi:hypothetical protein
MARALFLAVFILGAVVFGEWGVRWLVAPWSYAALGPTLTGTWSGPLRAQQGAEYRVFFNLTYSSSNRRFWTSNLAGEAFICTQQGEMYDYTVRGDADRNGHNVVISTIYGDAHLSALGMHFEGDWDGQTLTLTPANNPFLPDGRFIFPRSVSTADPDDNFAMAMLQRSDRPSFLAACGRLAQ